MSRHARGRDRAGGGMLRWLGVWLGLIVAFGGDTSALIPLYAVAWPGQTM